MKKRLLKGICALTLAAAQSVSAFGAVANVNVDNKAIDFGSDESVIEDGTTYVPIRAVFENFGEGTTVDWDAETKAVTINYNGEELVLYTSTGDVSYKGNTTVLSNTPIIQNGRTLLPLRELCEMLGGKVEWDGETKTVNVTTPGATTEEEQPRTQEEVVIPSGIDEKTAEEIRSMAGKPLPQCVYVAFESDNVYAKEEIDAVCSVADCRGYYNLEQYVKAICDENTILGMDEDTYDETMEKFSNEYFTALFKLDDKSFIKSPIMSAIFTDDFIYADPSVSVKDTARILSSTIDPNGEKIAVNPNMELLARIIYAVARMSVDGVNVEDTSSSDDLSFMLDYVYYALNQNPGWASMLPDATTLLTNQKRASIEVESLAGEPLPKAIYYVLSDEKLKNGMNQVANLKKALEIANSTDYKELKKAFTDFANAYAANDSDTAYTSTAFKLYFEALNDMSDKSFLTGLTADIYKVSVATGDSVTVDDMFTSIDKHLENSSVKVVAPPDLEVFAKVLTATLQDIDDIEAFDDTVIYMADYLAYEAANNKKISSNYNAAEYISDVLSYVFLKAYINN
jgi:hypothetical protein